MLKKYLIPINFILSLVAGVLVFFAVRVLFFHESPERTANFREPAKEKAAEFRLRDRPSGPATYDVISKYNLFRSDRKEWETAFSSSYGSGTFTLVSSGSGAVTLEAPPELKLMGIIYSERSKFAFIEGTKEIMTPKRTVTVVQEISGVKRKVKKKVGGISTNDLTGKKFFRLNERIGRYYIVSEIHPDYVVLKKDSGERMELRLKLEKGKKEPNKKGHKKKHTRKARPHRPKLSGA